MQARQDKSDFVKKAVLEGWLSDTTISLIDVGASGGIGPFWDQFRPHLRAVGFDPLIAEVDRLNAEEPDSQIRYEAAWVGNGSRPELLADDTGMFSKTSCWRALKATGIDFTRDVFNRGTEVVHTDTAITIDGYLKSAGFGDIDVLKIDTDGYDFHVLEGASDALARQEILVVLCECTFHEMIGRRWPVFGDIDRFMRDRGYRLIDLDKYVFSRYELPQPFLYDMPAQTVSGQIRFCDALYALDPSVDAGAASRLAGDAAKLRKLILLLAAFGYPDVAAAQIFSLRDKSGWGELKIDDSMLDLLVPANPFGAKSYADYVAAFDASPQEFFATAWDAANTAVVHDRAARARPPRGRMLKSLWRNWVSRK